MALAFSIPTKSLVAYDYHTFPLSIRDSLMLKRSGLDMMTMTVGVLVSQRLTPRSRAMETLLPELQGASIAVGDLDIGFGPDHLVQLMMKETFRGPDGNSAMTSCVCLCAALSVCYDSFFAAKVLDELFTIRGLTEVLRPALKDWRSLLDAFDGYLAWSAFPATLGRFEHVVSSRPLTTRFEGRQLPTDPKHLARAIEALADVSSGLNATHTFTGGSDCAWLAAVAEWILGLNVTIFSEHNSCTYRTHPSPETNRQIIILRSSDREDKCSQRETSRLNLLDIPNGSPVLWAGDSTSDHPRNKVSSWSTLLCDTFGSRHLKSLLNPSTGANFAKLLRSAILYPEHHPLSKRNSAQASQSHWSPSPKTVTKKGQLYLKFIRKHLPELLPCLLGFNENSQDTLMPPIAFHSALTAACGCQKCSNHQRSHTMSYEICLTTTAYTIVSFAWLLFPILMDRRTLPSVTGLEQLYFWTSISETVTEDGFQDHLKRDLHTVNTLLTGRITQPKGAGSNQLAQAENGICIFKLLIEDFVPSLTQPMEFKIVPGHMFYKNCQYLLLEDIESDGNLVQALRQDTRQQRGDQQSKHSGNSTHQIRIDETTEYGVLQASCEISDAQMDAKRVVSILDMVKPFSLETYDD